MTIVCCVCGKCKNKDEWSHEEHDAEVIVSHGYCPKCTDKVLQEIRDWNNSHSEVDKNNKSVA